MSNWFATPDSVSSSSGGRRATRTRAISTSSNAVWLQESSQSRSQSQSQSQTQTPETPVRSATLAIVKATTARTVGINKRNDCNDNDDDSVVMLPQYSLKRRVLSKTGFGTCRCCWRRWHAVLR